MRKTVLRSVLLEAVTLSYLQIAKEVRSSFRSWPSTGDQCTTAPGHSRQNHNAGIYSRLARAKGAGLCFDQEALDQNARWTSSSGHLRAYVRLSPTHPNAELVFVTPIAFEDTGDPESSRCEEKKSTAR